MNRVALPVCLALASAARADLVLVNEGFNDLERRNDAAPSSLTWTSGAHHTTAASAFTAVDASSGALTWDHTLSAGVNSFSGIWAHVTPAGTPQNLAVGEGLRLSFEASFAGGSFSTAVNGFRWALFDSGGVRTTTDFAGTNETGLASGTTFSGWRGYTAQTTVNGTEIAGNNFLTRERTGSGNGLFVSTNYTDVTGSAVDEPEFLASTPYTFTLELARTLSGMEVRGSVNGLYTALAVDATPVTSFDTISLFVLDGVTHNVTVDNVQLTLVTVPEPATAALGLLGALVLVRRRR